MPRFAPALLLTIGLASAMACAPPKPASTTATGARAGVEEGVRVLSGRPPIALVSRDGDPRSAIAIAVATGGIAPGPQPAVALAALVEARLRARSLSDALVTPAWDGYRAKLLVAGEAEAASAVEAMRAALSAPVTEAEITAVDKKLAALATRPLRDQALLDAARCTGEPFAGLQGAEPERAALDRVEAWRRAAHGLGRVAIAVAGSDAIGEAAASALAKGPVWPAAPARAEGEPLPPADAPIEVYDASADTPAGSARVTLAVHTPSAAQALSVAPLLGAARGPLASRLGALDAPARVRDVVATAHPRGGCLTLTLEMPPSRSAGDFSTHLATVVALARQEVGVEIAESESDPTIGRAIARRAGDPRDAAERAAWWTLVADREEPVRMSTAVGVATGRDAPTGLSNDGAIRAAIDRATVAWQTPVLEARTRVERGQGDLWLMVASTCGTSAEAESDAGLGAAFALAASERGREPPSNAEAWIAPDGLGLLAHGGALAAETPAAHARRLADAIARPFAADPVDAPAVARARADLLRASDQDDMRALGAMASAIAPGHPSWLSPYGTVEALGRSSDAAIVGRAAALRAGPLRAAILANVDSAQADAAGRAIDRWIARRPGETRACPVPSTPAPPRPGTYSVERTSAPLAEAWIAAPLPASDADARVAAQWVATALDGDGGLMSRALAGLARSWGAKVVGAPRASALVLRIATAHGAIDAAVAQLRALVDRLRQGALADADRARAAQVRDRDAATASLDPRNRLLSLWRGDASAQPPSLDAMRALCANALKDDALVIVATRPPRGR